MPIFYYIYIFVQSMNAINSPYIAIASARATNINTRPNTSGFSAVAPVAATPVADIAQPAANAEPVIVIAADSAIHALSVIPPATAAPSCAEATSIPMGIKSKQSINAKNVALQYLNFISISISSLLPYIVGIYYGGANININGFLFAYGSKWS
jgi:hypothetical protein